MSSLATPRADGPPPASGRRVSLRADKLLTNVALAVFVVVLGYLTIAPLVRLQGLALEDGAAAYSTAFSAPGAWQTVLRTLGLGFGSLAIALVLGTGLAWAATTLSPRLQLLRILPVLPMVVPGIAFVLGWAFLLSPRPGYLNALLRELPWWSGLDEGPLNIYTLEWIIIINGLALAAYVYLFVSAGLERINGELLDAAHVSGSSRVATFFRVTLPLLRPALVYGGGVALLVGLGQFTAPLLLGRNEGVTVLTTNMYMDTQLVPPDYGAAAAIGSPLLVLGIVVLALHKFLLGDQARFVTHGGRGFRSAARTSRVGAAAIVVYAIFSTLLPVLALAFVGLSRFWTPTIDLSALTLDNFREVFATPGIVSAIETSLVTSIVAVAIALPLGYVAATVLLDHRSNRVARPILDFIVAMPLSIPAVIFGVGFLLTYTHEPLILYGTDWVLILVYVTLMLPFSTRMQLSGMIALGTGYAEAAKVSGAGPLKTHLTILVPLMRATFGGAAALMFVLLASEFAASVLVRAPSVQVMGTVLYDYYNNGSYPLTACIALVMIGVTAVGVAIAGFVGGSDLLKRL